MASRSTRLLACLVVVVGAALATPEMASAAGVPAPVPGPKITVKKSEVAKTDADVSIAATTRKASTVSAGWLHTCAVTSKAAAICWGYNGYGELGDNTATSSAAPVAVYGLDHGVKSVTGGFYHSCALTTAGKVWCWGYNGYGALGDGTTTTSLKPVQVAGIGKAKAVSAGYLHTCALTTKGKVWCWGYNAYGQLGDNTTTSSTTPVQVYGLSKVSSISTGYEHSCALTSKGKAYCWGYNAYGQLGDNTATNSPKPVTVYGMTSGVKALSAGIFTTCGVTSKGAAKCWGYNDYGQLGNNTTTTSLKPVQVTGLTKKVASVKPSYTHTCAVTKAGKVKCWGYNGYGELGDNTTTNSLVPVSVYNLDKASKVTLGSNHSCALTAKKAVKCWGYNFYGQLGDNTTTTSLHPVKVYGF
ncbi:MAG: hypothetical protein QM779_10870 [Propionicimonas sp.]|uniref:RCC1 domain-containing protein n=1 Tax=Propionicimonas sp. TaxID=1955623 RepID=UPI003D0DDB6C